MHDKNDFNSEDRHARTPKLQLSGTTVHSLFCGHAYARQSPVKAPVNFLFESPQKIITYYKRIGHDKFQLKWNYITFYICEDGSKIDLKHVPNESLQ